MEPTPGDPYTETWERFEERTERLSFYVNRAGVVLCSAELMRQLLEQAGWERVS